MGNKVIIVGGFHEIIELAEDCDLEIVGIIDNVRQGAYYHYKILGSDEDVGVLKEKFKTVPLIITPDKPEIRDSLVKLYTNNGFCFEKIISSKASIARSSKIGNGSIIQSGVNVSSEVNIGSFVKLNSLCNIMHNAFIGDFTTIAPNAVVLGNVKIGKACYIGANSTILPNTEICDHTIIGAGAVVTKSIYCQGIYTGIPAKMVKD